MILISQLLAGIVIISGALLLPAIARSVKLSKRHLSSSAVEIAQGILLAYAIIYCIIVPLLTFIAEFIRL